MRRFLRFGIAGLVLAGVIAAASAQAASNKPYTANVRVENASDPNTFRLTLTNDPKASQSLGSANFTPPAGFTAGAVSNVSNAGFTVTVVNNVVQFRANSSSTALGKGATVYADVAMTIPVGTACTSARWSVEAKQSNDFSGQPGNDMTPNPASDLTPLGSFTFAPIGTNVSGVFVPQVRILDGTFAIGVNAWDTCGYADSDYTGATVGPTATQVPARLLNVSFSALTFSGGVATGSANISRANVEAGDTITATDGASGIFAVSTSGGTAPNSQSKVVPRSNDPFDVVQTICTGSGTLCTWHNNNGSINANSTVPGDVDASLGFGFRSQNTISSTTCDSAITLIGDVVDINPHHYSGSYQVTIVYSKSLTGNGPASSFHFCLSETDTQSWTSLPLCSASITTKCIVSQGRVNGGALQFILMLPPGDPWGGVG
jgi:hypothetical protein